MNRRAIFTTSIWRTRSWSRCRRAIIDELINETLRHLQTDVTGNSHRSEMSFDKFWNTSWPPGALGLIEFRAIESLPRADWM